MTPTLYAHRLGVMAAAIAPDEVTSSLGTLALEDRETELDGLVDMILADIPDLDQRSQAQVVLQRRLPRTLVWLVCRTMSCPPTEPVGILFSHRYHSRHEFFTDPEWTVGDAVGCSRLFPADSAKACLAARMLVRVLKYIHRDTAEGVALVLVLMHEDERRRTLQREGWLQGHVRQALARPVGLGSRDADVFYRRSLRKLLKTLDDMMMDEARPLDSDTESELTDDL